MGFRGSNQLSLVVFCLLVQGVARADAASDPCEPENFARIMRKNLASNRENVPSVPYIFSICKDQMPKECKPIVDRMQALSHKDQNDVETYENFLQLDMTDDQYQNMVDQKAPYPKELDPKSEDVRKLFNAVGNRSATDASVEAAVDTFKTTLVKKNPGAKIVPVTDPHEATGSNGRVLIYLPAKDSDNPKIDRYIQMVLGSAGADSGQTAIVSVDRTDPSNPKSYFRVFYREYATGAGEIGKSPQFTRLVNQRENRSINTGSCMECHVSGPMAYVPESIPQKYLAELNSINNSMDRAEQWPTQADRDRQEGPIFGPDDSKYRTASLMEKCAPTSEGFSDASRTKIKENMNCMQCHDGATQRNPLSINALSRGMIAYRIFEIGDSLHDPKTADYLKSSLVKHQMPPDVGYKNPLTLQERKALFQCLTMEYYGTDENSGGIYTDYLLGAGTPAGNACFDPAKTAAEMLLSVQSSTSGPSTASQNAATKKNLPVRVNRTGLSTETPGATGASANK